MTYLPLETLKWVDSSMHFSYNGVLLSKMVYICLKEGIEKNLQHIQMAIFLS